MNIMFLIWALGRQREAGLSEFKGSLVYIASSRIAGATRRPWLKKTPPSKKKNRKKLKQKLQKCLSIDEHIICDMER